MSNLTVDEIPYQTAPDASSNTALAIRNGFALAWVYLVS
jgi:hypothetical protein